MYFNQGSHISVIEIDSSQGKKNVKKSNKQVLEEGALWLFCQQHSQSVADNRWRTWAQAGQTGFCTNE